MKEIKVCPFCGAENTVIISNDKTFYHCNNCETDFTEDDLVHEILRQRISSICSDEEATEDHPLDCTKGKTMLVIGDDEAMGLSELDKPQVINVFNDYEAIVWVTLYGYNEPIELDSLSTSDLKNILEWLETEYSYNTVGLIEV
jgi:hypothetical protein